MKKGKRLFSYSHNAPSPEYQAVLNATNERNQKVKAHCEDLWHDFSDHADENFLKEFPVNFHQRWFEMYLTVSLIRKGLTVKCPKPGPDVLLTVDGRRIWIEAVCATEGQAGKPDSVPRREKGKAQNVPTSRQHVARIRNSLDEKEKKFRKYIRDKIVCRNDLTVIAVNCGEIPFLWADFDDRMIRSLYGVGDRFLIYDKASAGIVNAGRKSIQKIEKTSGAAIGVQPFLDGSMEHVSSALASWACAFNLPSELGGDYVLYPNLSCTNRWTTNLLPVAEEWSFRETEDWWSGEKIQRMR